MSLDVVGFENAEKIEFNSNESSITLPGFNSDIVIADYKVSENKLIISPKKSGTETTNLTSEIFSQIFKIVKGNRKGELILKSDLTNIHMFNEEIALNDRVKIILNEL